MSKDYEKKYNEALKDMRAIYPNLKGDAKLAVEHAFPELAESEDERIRSVILKLVLGMRDEIFTTADKLVTKPKVLAWLEKQKEQPTNEEMLRTLRAEYEKGVADTIANAITHAAETIAKAIKEKK